MWKDRKLKTSGKKDFLHSEFQIRKWINEWMNCDCWLSNFTDWLTCVSGLSFQVRRFHQMASGVEWWKLRRRCLFLELDYLMQWGAGQDQEDCPLSNGLPHFCDLCLMTLFVSLSCLFQKQVEVEVSFVPARYSQSSETQDDMGFTALMLITDKRSTCLTFELTNSVEFTVGTIRGE